MRFSSSHPTQDQNLDYVTRVNRVIDHVVEHIAEPVSLETAAELALFSPYHFHRIFKSLMGETLNEFVRRIRLERALAIRTHQPSQSWTEIALACGFASSSDFSRCFTRVWPSSGGLAGLQPLYS